MKFNMSHTRKIYLKQVYAHYEWIRKYYVIVNSFTRSIVALALLSAIVLYGPTLLYPTISKSDLRAQRISGKDVFQIQSDRLKLQNDARGTLLQGIAGAAVLLGAFLTARQVKASRDIHTTDQFIRAVEQLGRPDRTTEITLGGIYGMERVARDSASERRGVGEIFASFIREHAEPVTRRDQPDNPTPEIQAAITVLARGQFHDIQLFLNRDIRLIDLSGVNLNRIDIYQLALPTTSFSHASLREAFVVDADLRYADLMYADLHGIIANQTNLSKTALNNTDCGDGHFYNAKFVGAILQETNLSRANLQSADFTGALLKNTNLRSANLSGAHLLGATFEGVIADASTKWPSGFDPKSMGVTIESASK